MCARSRSVAVAYRLNTARQRTAVRTAVRLHVRMNAGSANTAYTLAIAASSTSSGLIILAADGKVRHTITETAMSVNRAMSMFARSTANMIAGEHNAKAS